MEIQITGTVVTQLVRLNLVGHVRRIHLQLLNVVKYAKMAFGWLEKLVMNHLF